MDEVNDKGKQPFLSQAATFLFPISWPEPFGLVMIEAMAYGTPVMAYRSGSVPEVVDEGVTGFIVDNETHAAEAVARLAEIDRRQPCEVRRALYREGEWRRTMWVNTYRF